MTMACIIVLGLTIVANTWAIIADFTKAGFVLKTADEVHVARSWLPILGALKAAGVVGLILGMLGIHLAGTAAAAGLVIFFVGAVTAHVQAKVYYNIAFPVVFLALAVASLVLSAINSHTALPI
jgi:DoxX-like family